MVHDDEVDELAEKEQEEVLTKTVISLTGFNEEVLLAALSWLSDHKMQQWMFLRKRVQERRQWVRN